MPAVGIDGPEYDVVVKHYGAVEAANIEVEHLSGLGDAGQADDSGRRRRVETAADEGRRSRAFHQNVGSEPFEVARVAVVGRAEIAHERPLRTALVVIEHVHVEIALLSHQRRQKPDGPGPGDEQRPRLPRARAVADALGMVPGLGEDAGGLQQHAEDAQCRVELDREVRLDTEAFGAVAVPLLDTALGVAPVATHVPLSVRAREARHRIGPAYDADDEIAGCEAATLGRRLDHAQRFMTENEALLTGRSKAITALEDFAVGRTHPERQSAHQNRAIRLRWFGDLLEPRRVGGAGRNGDCAHPCPWIAFGSRRALSPRSAIKLSALSRATNFPANAVDETSTPDAKKSSGGAKRKSGRPRYQIYWENGGAAWRPLDASDGQSPKATFPPKAPFPTAR